MPSRLAAGPAALSRGSSSRRPANLFRDRNQSPRQSLTASRRPMTQLLGCWERALAGDIIGCDFIIQKGNCAFSAVLCCVDSEFALLLLRPRRVLLPSQA